jgi:hypothetical protein
MNMNKFVILCSLGYVLLYGFSYYLAKHGKLASGGDAAGNGMERGFRVLLIMAIFFIIAIGLTITNYVLLKKITDTSIKYIGFIPITTSIGHIAYTILFG